MSQIEILAYIGVGLYVFSGLIFGGLPVIEFRKKGRVRKGKSYIHTTRRYWNIFYRSPSTVCNFYNVGNCWYAAFPALDYDPAGYSHYSVDIY